MFKSGAMKGHSDSQYTLGQLYIQIGNDLGVHVNIPDAIELIQKAANQGHTEALNTLEKIISE